MRYLRFFLISLVILPVLYSCNKKLEVNADWRDITVVYGLLNQAEDTTYIKITKAFLGEGDAMMFAKIADSSIYPDKLDVRLEEWSGSTLVKTYTDFDTITRQKDQDTASVFYPGNLVYYKVTGHLNENNTFWLKIRHKKTGVVDSAVTKLVHNFEVVTPDPFIKLVDYLKGSNFTVQYYPAYGGKRYQLIIRFHYLEFKGGLQTEKTVNWAVFSDLQVTDPYVISTEPILNSFRGDLFYSALRSGIPYDPDVSERLARYVDYVFSVASEDLNTYMEATEPSLSIIQERPSFSNIFNGIGLFSSRYVNEIDSVRLGSNTILTIKADTALIRRKF
jgi:hypothetical protein